MELQSKLPLIYVSIAKEENFETDYSNKCLKKDIYPKRRLRSRVNNAEKYIKKYKCHICRDKKERGKVMVCMNYQLCHHTFCQGCIDKCFRMRFKKEHLKTEDENWPCFICRGICKCKRCKKVLADEFLLLSSKNPEYPKNKKSNIYI